MRISLLNPVGAIFGKELRVTARRKRTYFLRFIYLGVLLLFLLGAYSAGQYQGQMQTNALLKTQQLSAMGEEFFHVFAYFTIVAMVLLGPVLTSTSMSGERLHKTLPVLLMTPLSSWQIITGKLLSRVLVAATLIGLSLPALAIVRLLGGVELDAMFAVICLCLSTVLLGGAIGLFFSTCINRAYGTIILSYGVLLLLYGIFPLLMSVMMYSNAQAGGKLPGPGFGFLMTLTNPFFATVCVLEPTGMRMLQLPPWWVCLIGQTSAAAVLVLLSSLLLRRSARKLAEGGASPAVSGEQEVRGARSMLGSGLAVMPPPLPPMGVAAGGQMTPALPVVDARPAERGRDREVRSVSDNPVLWREVRRPMMARRWQRIAGACACVGLLLFTYVWIGKFKLLENRDTQIGYAFIFNGILMLMVCALAGTTIAQERESDTWTLLLASPISGKQIVWGKAMGVLRRMLWPTALVILHFVSFAIAGVITWMTAWVVCWVIISFNALFVATGTYLSLRMKKVLTAVALNLLVPLVMYLGVFLGLQLIDSNHRAGEVVGAYLPYNYIGEGIEELTPYGHFRERLTTDTNSTFHLEGIGSVTRSDFVCYAILVGGVHLFVAAAILQLTARRFNAIVGRATQRDFLPAEHGAIPI